MSATLRRTTTLTERRPAFAVKALVDRRNQRLRVAAYQYDGEVAPLSAFLLETAREQGLSKIVVPARGGDWQALLTRGFFFEGMVARYYRGAPGHFMAYFLTGERQASNRLEAEQQLLQEVLEKPAQPPEARVPDGYELAVAGPEIADRLAAVYDQVFESYPSPLTDPAYIRELIASGGGLFMVMLRDGQIASAAAAEIDREEASAEITNCATLPDYRGEGLMQVLIGALEAEMARREVPCLYSMARAGSFGMNLVLHRLGYIYRGRLINHAHIGGGFEDLNLWEKSRAD